jgi:phosphatidylglycerol:prolipoprotein diacylglycerol transferase
MYFGLPYIHAVFDVAAWFASMTVFWLVTRHLLPAEALPANRVPYPGAYAIAAGMGALSGIVFAAPFSATVAVGRWGCFFSGLADFTYGTPTTLPWGVDFGDGIHRHPVQLYESFAMAAMFFVLIQRFRARDAFWLRNGFYLTVGWYALQRFVWEFFKPYATVIGPFNLFHVVCLGLVLYAAAMIRSGGRDVRWRSA